MAPPLGTLWRTVRHLKMRQLSGRVAFRLTRPQPQLAVAPPLRVWQGKGAAWVLPAQRRPSLLGPQRFCFLNQQAELADIGWQGPAVEKLWRYNQHYFDDLNAQGADARRSWHLALISQWLQANPPGQGDGWEPYPVSLRIVNWAKAWAGGLPLPPDALHSLAVQARWLMQRLEWHLLGNHLFANAKALVMAGLVFEGAEAQTWLHKGLEILAEQVPEQMLPDGGQFERSPMYHTLALEDMLDLLNAVHGSGHAQQPGPWQQWQQVAGRMLGWLQVMTHPDGTLAHFNDSAHGIAPSGAELARYAGALHVGCAPLPPEGLTVLRDSGYVRAQWGPACVLLDVAPVGPDYLPGHAHADTLSFELSVHGRRVIVNGGTSRYGTGAQRLAERGTAAHSTVQVAGVDSSEVWAGFRVGRRAYVHGLQVADGSASAWHDGYTWLKGAPRHQRSWQWAPGLLRVVDEVGPGTHAAIARYHLAPGLTCHPDGGDGRWVVADGQGLVLRVTVEEGQGQVLPSRHAPEFGVVHPTQCLAVSLMGGRSATSWAWL